MLCLTGMHEEYDNNDESVDPTKTPTVEDALDAVVAEVECHSPKFDSNYSSDVLTPAGSLRER